MNPKKSAPRSSVDALARRAVASALGRLKVDRSPSEELAEHVIDLVGSGALDAELRELSPPVASERQRRRYSAEDEFSHEQWKRHHGIED